MSDRKSQTERNNLSAHLFQTREMIKTLITQRRIKLRLERERHSSYLSRILLGGLFLLTL